jgi:hypothetical protein
MALGRRRLGLRGSAKNAQSKRLVGQSSSAKTARGGGLQAGVLGRPGVGNRPKEAGFAQVIRSEVTDRVCSGLAGGGGQVTNLQSGQAVPNKRLQPRLKARLLWRKAHILLRLITRPAETRHVRPQTQTTE